MWEKIVEIESRLLTVMKDAINFEGEEIDKEEDFFDGSLLLDSIDILEIVLGIKKEFGIEIAVDKGEEVLFRNFNEMLNLVNSRLEEKE